MALPVPLRILRAPVARALRARGSGVLDALLYGRGWIALVGVLLVGIVFFNVDLLKLNRDIAATAQRAGGVARENARLRLEVARLDSSERIQRAAAARGLLLPAPGDVRYLRAHPLLDARRAAKRVDASGPSASVAEPAPAAPQPQPQTQAQLQPQPQTQAPQPQVPTPAGPGATTTPPAG